jgi:co-chaperonin GroES (HSP10)
METATTPAPIDVTSLDVTSLQKAGAFDPADFRAPFLAEVQSEKELIIDPKGYLILVQPRVPARSTKGSIIIPDEVRDREALLSQVGQVLDIGPDAFKDEDKFPSGPRCKVGDYVLFGRAGGIKVSLREGDLRLLNDDEILAVVNDPEAFDL